MALNSSIASRLNCCGVFMPPLYGCIKDEERRVDLSFPASRQTKMQSSPKPDCILRSDCRSGQACFAPLILAQRAFCAAAILARPSALILFFLAGLMAGFADFVAAAETLCFAHRAFWAAATLARPEALIPRFFFGSLTATGASTSRIEASSWFNDSICSLISAARRSWAVVNGDNWVLIGY